MCWDEEAKKVQEEGGGSEAFFPGWGETHGCLSLVPLSDFSLAFQTRISSFSNRGGAGWGAGAGGNSLN